MLTSNQTAMETYIEPKIHIVDIFVCQSCICASFDSYNETEKWVIGDSEDI